MTDRIRQRAEERAEANASTFESVLSPEQMRKVLHELQVHQIELEMQNEELRRVQIDLEAARARYFDLYDLAPVGYVTLSDQGMILEANFTLAKMLGLARNALVKEPLSRYIFRDDQDIYYLYRKRLETAGELQTCELRMVKDDGVPFWVVLETTSGLDESNQDASRIVISNISARKNAEDKQLQIEGIIQHDLRAPASNAVNISRLLLNDENLTADQHELLSLLESAGIQMLDTLSRAQTLYKIESGRHIGLSQSFDCLLLIREIAKNFNNVSEYKQAHIDILVHGVSPAPSVQTFCHGQPELLRGALDNLIRNALEASPQAQSVSIDLIRGVNLLIRIRNRGVVPLTIRDRFFEKFITSGKEFGTGLGTYSAKLMVEAQGGSLDMQTSDERNETVVMLAMPT